MPISWLPPPIATVVATGYPPCPMGSMARLCSLLAILADGTACDLSDWLYEAAEWAPPGYHVCHGGAVAFCFVKLSTTAFLLKTSHCWNCEKLWKGGFSWTFQFFQQKSRLCAKKSAAATTLELFTNGVANARPVRWEASISSMPFSLISKNLVIWIWLLQQKVGSKRRTKAGCYLFFLFLSRFAAGLTLLKHPGSLDRFGLIHWIVIEYLYIYI